MYCKYLLKKKSTNKYLSKKFKTQVCLNKLANVGYISGNLLPCNTYSAKLFT